MVNMDEIENYMMKQNITKSQLAKMMGISRKTLDKRFNRKVLLAAECNALIKLLKIENPSQIFFSSKLLAE